MKRFALAGNPNSGKTTLFNKLTGSTAHVGNWPGVTVDKREGMYKKGKEPVQIIDLPGIYSLSPYTPEEVISRNFILDEKPDAVINIVDATNLERNLYLTTQLLEMDVPVVIALNMSDLLVKELKSVDTKLLESVLKVPVVSVSALKGDGIETLMDSAIDLSNTGRKGESVLQGSRIYNLVEEVTKLYVREEIENPLFHALKLIENDEIELKGHKNLIAPITKFKETFNDDVFGNDLEAVIADERYKFISANCAKAVKAIKAATTVDEKGKKEKKHEHESGMTRSDRIDRVLTNRWAGIPIFLLILFLGFHLIFAEDFLYLNAMGLVDVVFNEGGPFEGVFANGGISSPGVIINNFILCLLDLIVGGLTKGVEALGAAPWLTGLLGDGVFSGLFAVLGFLPWILELYLFFSILEDTGYMARVAFILDRIFRKFGISGRAFIPMIMGFGCSVPAMVNTRTLADEREKIATVRVIPFFSCGAKLPILTAIAGGLVSFFGVGNADAIVFGMYVLGMVTAVVTVLIMRSSTLKGEVAPFIMELPAYHAPSFKGLMIHLWDKTKAFVKKACTIILVSTVLIWVLLHFSFDWKFLTDELAGQSILANLSMMVQPIFTPLGFGSQLHGVGWVFVAAAVAGLIAKEEVVTIFAILAAVVTGGGEFGEADAVVQLIQNTGITIPGLISFIAFNMTTIPCFAAVATAKAELPKGKIGGTIAFWLITSYIVGIIVYVSGTWLWTIPIWIVAIVGLLVGLFFLNKHQAKKLAAKQE